MGASKMSEPKTFKVGQAPWEVGKAQTFKVGQAPWEVQAPVQTSGIGQTALEHFGSGVGMGYLPELQALAEPVTTAIGNAVTGANVQADPYIVARDQNAARLARQASDHPFIAPAAGLAGGLTSGIATTALMPAAAPTAFGRVSQLAKAGVIYGGLANPGNTPGEIAPVQLPKRIENAGEGGLLSLLLGSLAEAPGLLKESVRGTSNYLANQASKGVEFTPVANKGQIEKAGKALGLDVPRAVLTDNPTYQDLESGLSQSGSLPARGVRKQYDKFFQGLDDAAGKIEDLKTTQSDFSLGAGIKQDLGNRVNASRELVGDIYKKLTPDLQKIPVDQGIVNRAFGDLKKNSIFQTQDGRAMLEEFKDIALGQPELNSLKEWRSSFSDMVSKTDAPIQGKRIDALRTAVTKIRDNSINAMKEQLPARMHGEVDHLIDTLSLADSAHSSNLQDVNSIKKVLGNSEYGSPSTFVNKLGDVTEADLAQRAANLDVKSLSNLKEKYPSVFEKAKQAKINDMIQSSTNPSKGFNVNTFMRHYDGLDNETKALIFSPEFQSHIENLKVIKQALPEKLGPSGTPKGLMTMDMFNPKRNALDLGVKSVLNASKEAEPAASAMINPDELGTSEFQVGKSIGQFAKTAKAAAQDNSSISKPAGIYQLTKSSDAPSAAAQAAQQKAADTEKKTGEEKWVNDGFKKLMDHSGDKETKDLLNRHRSSMLDDKTLKGLAISASDLKPGSTAMEKILSQIKDRLEVREMFEKPGSGVDDLIQGKPFKDSNRRPENPSESLDSYLGAPARTLIDEFQKGNFNFSTLKKMVNAFGSDPKNAPSGFDIASKVTDNPYAGSALATLVDLGAQIPVGTLGKLGKLTPGMVSSIEDLSKVKNLNGIADASEAFKARGAKPPSTETKIAQMYGQTGDVRDAVGKLSQLAEEDWKVAQAKGISMKDAEEYRSKYHSYSSDRFAKSAYDNPKNAPPKMSDLTGPEPREAAKASPEKIYKVQSDNVDGYLTGDAYKELRLQMSSGDFGSHKAELVKDVPKGAEILTTSDITGEEPAAAKELAPPTKYQKDESGALKGKFPEKPEERQARLQAERAERDKKLEAESAAAFRGKTKRAREIVDEIAANEDSTRSYYEGGDFDDDAHHYMLEGKKKLKDFSNMGPELEGIVDRAKSRGVSEEKIMDAIRKHSRAEPHGIRIPDDEYLESFLHGEHDVQHDGLEEKLKDFSPDELTYIKRQTGLKPGDDTTYTSLDDLVHYLLPDHAAIKAELAKHKNNSPMPKGKK